MTLTHTVDSARNAAAYALSEIAHGRIQRTMSGITAASALLVCGEVYYEHYKGSFGNKLMWSPIVATPPIFGAAVAGVFSTRAARTVLPLTSLLYTLTGAAGVVMHVRGVARKPGGWTYARYNVVMGPPVIAPGLFAMVGGMGLLAAAARREGKA